MCFYFIFFFHRWIRCVVVCELKRQFSFDRMLIEECGKYFSHRFIFLFVVCLNNDRKNIEIDANGMGNQIIWLANAKKCEMLFIAVCSRSHLQYIRYYSVSLRYHFESKWRDLFAFVVRSNGRLLGMMYVRVWARTRNHFFFLFRFHYNERDNLFSAFLPLLQRCENTLGLCVVLTFVDSLCTRHSATILRALLLYIIVSIWLCVIFWPNCLHSCGLLLLRPNAFIKSHVIHRTFTNLYQSYMHSYHAFRRVVAPICVTDSLICDHIRDLLWIYELLAFCFIIFRLIWKKTTTHILFLVWNGKRLRKCWLHKANEFINPDAKTSIK